MGKKVNRNKPRQYKKPYEEKSFLGKAWHFIWEDNSPLSWLANVVLAFILIKFIVYPLMGLLLGSQLPVVAVISESMMHTPTPICEQRSILDGSCISYNRDVREICGERLIEKGKYDLDSYWERCGRWYEDNNISQEAFATFDFKNGFDKGDVIVLRGVEPAELEVGDVLVFDSGRAYPIIHRIVDKQEAPSGYIFTTKGDHNTVADEGIVQESQIIGRASMRIPYLGWVKIVVVNFFQAIF